MSFLPINKDNELAPQGQTTNAPQTEVPPETPSSGGSVGEESGGPAAQGSATGSPTQFGSSASKLGDYLSANAPQVQGQADTVAGNLNTQYGQLQSGITNAANQFGQQVQGGYAANNPDAVNQAVANPSQFAMNPDSVKAFQGQYNNQYTGPQSFTGSQGYGDIQGKVQAGVQQGNLLGSQAGLQSYLQNQSLGGPNSTNASATLDALLMRGNPGAQKTIQDAAGQFGNLTGQLDIATTGANDSVQAAQKAAQDSQAYAQSQFNPVMANWQTGLTNTVAGNEAQRAKYNAAQSDILSKLTTGGGAELTADQLAQLGPNASYPQIEAFNRLGTTNTQQYGGAGNVNLANYLQGSLNPYNNIATAANSATPGDYSTANAFSQLAGQGFNNPLPTTQGDQWSLPTSSGATLNTGGALEAQGGALKTADQQIVAAHGNPYLDEQGNPVGLSASNPDDVYRVISALQRLGNPEAYTGIDQTITPPTPSGIPLQPLTQTTGSTPTSGGGQAYRSRGV